jgi:hypothetical protein
MPKQVKFQERAAADTEKDGRNPPSPGTLAQKLSIAGALLNIVKVMLLIKLCCKHTFETCLAQQNISCYSCHLLPGHREEGVFDPTDDL